MDNTNYKINKFIEIAHWNSNGLNLKWNELKDFINKHMIQIMLVNETKIPHSRKLSLQGYNILRKDRISTKGGGLLIIIRNNLEYSEVNTPDNIETIETLGIKLSHNIAIYSAYVRPTNGNIINKIDSLELNKILSSANKTIIIGDFNAKHTSWFCKNNNINGKISHELLNKNNYSLIAPDKYTLHPTNRGQPSIVDFAIIKIFNNTIKLKTLNELDSDHLPIIMKLELAKNIVQDDKNFLNYHEAECVKFKEIIDNNLKINPKIKTKNDIEINLTNIIKNAINLAIPKKIKNKIEPLPQYIVKLIKIRNYSRRKYQKSRINYYKILKNQYACLVKDEVKKYNNN